MIRLTVPQARTIIGHPEREKRQAYAREYYQRNRATIVARACAWRLDNLDRAREKERRWRRRHPEHFRFHKALRRAGAGPAERTYIRILLGDPCSYCGTPCDSIDHVDPVIAGGSGAWDNLTAACSKCNGRKSGRPLLGFLHYNHAHLGIR